MMKTIRIHAALLSLFCLLGAAGCSSGGSGGAYPDDAAPDGASHDGAGGVDSGSLPDTGSNEEGGHVVNGMFRFEVDGNVRMATSINVDESSGYYTVTAYHDEANGIDFESVAIQYSKSDSGTDVCGGILGLPSRTVRYGRYFHTRGQVATKEQYLSGLPNSPNCMFTIAGHDPEAGSATGSLTSDKVLTGGSAPPPVNIAFEWSGIKP